MENRRASGILETVSLFNSTVRTVLAVVVVGALGYGGWYGYALYHGQERAAEQAERDLAQARQQLTQVNATLDEKNQELAQKAVEISKLNIRVDEQQEQIERLETSLRLLKVDHRVARLRVLEQQTDPDSGQLYSVVEFQELNQNGQPLEQPRQFRIKGDMVYVDSWVVKFDDKYVEQADLDRSTSLVFFRRIFGEFQEPHEGYVLDRQGQRPAAYARGGTMSDFEKRIWDDFWNVANDEAKQAELGIRAAHGDAPSIKVQKGKTYRIDLRASGGLTIDDEAELVPPAA